MGRNDNDDLSPAPQLQEVTAALDQLCAQIPGRLPWKKAQPRPEQYDGDSYLVAVPVQHRDHNGYHWEYHIIMAREEGYDNSDGDIWCAWTWDDVVWYLDIADLQPPGII